MSNLRSTIEGLASQFAANLIEALRGASIDELLNVAQAGGAGGRRAGRPAVSRGAEADSAAPIRARRGRGGRLGRRSQNDIAAMVESIVDLLGRNPEGLRAEQIREALGVEAKELPRPLNDALAAGRVTKSGQKRATTYFAGAGGSAAPKGGRGGRRAGAGRKKRA